MNRLINGFTGCRFKNDTERLEKLFELYTQMTAKAPAKQAAAKRTVRRKSAQDR